MGFRDRILQLFNDPSIPTGGRIFAMRTTEFHDDLKYDYKTIEDLMEDERVYSIVSMVSSMVAKSYMGPEIIPKDRYTDSKLDDKEKAAMASAEKFCRDMKCKELFFNWTWQLVSHGDLYERIIKTGKGIEELISLPLNSVRSLANEEQVRKLPQNLQIIEENMISVKRAINDPRPTIYKEGEYIHVSFKNHGVWRDDVEGMKTYGIYSIPPLAPLQRLVNWKRKTIENDIIWKNKLLPRILHKLKMPSIVPSKYTGTQQEKITAAKADAALLTDAFISSTKGVRPDDDLVISDAVDTSILEAKTVNYAQPNETISQINTFLNTPQGLPSGLLGGESGASMGVELAAIFAGIRVEYIAQKIAVEFAKLMKSHVRLSATSAGEETIDRLFIHVDPALSVEKFEKIKTAMSMAATGCFTKGEIRQATGYARLPQLEKEAFPEIDLSTVTKSLDDLNSNTKKEKPNTESNTSPKGGRNTMDETQ